MLARLGPIYLQTMPQTMADLRRVQHRQDRVALWETAHKIKGNAAAISAEPLRLLAHELERCALDADWGQVTQLIDQISAENARVTDWLNTQLA